MAIQEMPYVLCSACAMQCSSMIPIRSTVTLWPSHCDRYTTLNSTDVCSETRLTRASVGIRTDITASRARVSSVWVETWAGASLGSQSRSNPHYAADGLSTSCPRTIYKASPGALPGTRYRRRWGWAPRTPSPSGRTSRRGDSTWGYTMEIDSNSALRQFIEALRLAEASARQLALVREQAQWLLVAARLEEIRGLALGLGSSRSKRLEHRWIS